MRQGRVRETALARRAKDVHIAGIDFSPQYIEHATRQNHSPNITFRVGDICALPFADASIDRVLSQLVLHFVPDTERAVSELRRVARPGATVAAAVWDARGGLVAQRIFIDAAAALGQKGHEFRARSFTRPMTRPGELSAAWRAAGFVDIRETALAIRMEFASFDDFRTPTSARKVPGLNTWVNSARMRKTACVTWCAPPTSTAIRTDRGHMLRSHGRVPAPSPTNLGPTASQSPS